MITQRITGNNPYVHTDTLKKLEEWMKGKLLFIECHLINVERIKEMENHFFIYNNCNNLVMQQSQS